MNKITTTTLNFGATPAELVEAVKDFGRQPIVLTHDHDDGSFLNLTLGTTVPENRDNLERLGHLLTALGNALTAEAHTFHPDADEEADQ